MAVTVEISSFSRIVTPSQLPFAIRLLLRQWKKVHIRAFLSYVTLPVKAAAAMSAEHLAP